MRNLNLKRDRNAVNNTASNLSKRISPRFINFYPNKCFECGLCRQSYYCDTFLNRDSLTGAPILDPRNCTGCGLCVQICNREALQLVKSHELVVFISDLQETREIIVREELFPILIFRNSDICNHTSLKEKKWNKGLKSPKEMLEPTEFNKENLLNWSKELWKLRIANDRVAIKGEEDLRSESKDKCITSINDILKKNKTPKGNPDKSLLQNTIQKAIIWSQLIWSDPCQVLWESPLVAIESAIQTEDGKTIFERQNPTDAKEIPALIKSLCGKVALIKSAFIILSKGELIEGPFLVESSSFKLHELSNGDIEIYAKSGLGINRLAGLDILACGEFFICAEDWSELEKNPYEIFHIAGFPIKKLLENEVLTDISSMNFQRATTKV